MTDVVADPNRIQFLNGTKKFKFLFERSNIRKFEKSRYLNIRIFQNSMVPDYSNIRTFQSLNIGKFERKTLSYARLAGITSDLRQPLFPVRTLLCRTRFRQIRCSPNCDWRLPLPGVSEFTAPCLINDRSYKFCYCRSKNSSIYGISNISDNLVDGSTQKAYRSVMDFVLVALIYTYAFYFLQNFL